MAPSVTSSPISRRTVGDLVTAYYRMTSGRLDLLPLCGLNRSFTALYRLDFAFSRSASALFRREKHPGSLRNGHSPAR